MQNKSLKPQSDSFQWYRDELLKLGLNFHWHSYQEVGAGFEPVSFLQSLEQTGIRTVSIEARCELGWSYYPTKFGIQHPKLQYDYFGERVKVLRANGYRVIAYFNIGCAGQLFEKHPDYLVRVAAAGPWQPETSRPVNLNSPYYDQILIPQLKELMEAYSPDVLWLDIFSPDGMVGCVPDKWTSQLYAARYGTPLTEANLTSEDTRAFHIRRAEFLRARICSDLRPAKNKAAVAINWSFRFPRAEGVVTDILSGDANGFEHNNGCGNPFELGYYARNFAATDRPSDIISTTFRHWGEWDFKTAEALEREAAIVLANGSTYYLYDCAVPEGTLDPARCRNIGRLSAWVKERAAWFKTGKAEPEIILFNTSQSYETSERHNQAVHHQRAMLGASFFLQRHGHDFGVCSEHYFENFIEKARLIVAPRLSAVDPATARRLVQFVENGGYLCVAEALDPILASDFGIQFHPRSTYPRCFLKEANGFSIQGLAAMPLPLKTPPIGVKMLQGRCLMNTCAVSNEKELLAGLPYNWGYPPANLASASGGVAVRNYGKGKVLAIGPQIFEAYFLESNPFVASSLRAFLSELEFRSTFWVEDGIEMACRVDQSGEQTCLHLVNLPETAIQTIPLKDLPVRRNVWLGGHTAMPHAVTQQPEGKTLPVENTPDGWQVCIPELHAHTVLVLDHGTS